MESNIKDDIRKEGDSKATTTDGGHTRHDNAPSYSNWDAARHYGALGGHRYVYPPVPRDVWRQQMQQPNMYANYPGNTPYLGSPQPQGPVGQLQMHYGNQPYFNQMAYQQNSPMWNPPPTFSTEPAPSVHAQPITRNSAAERDETNVRVDNRQTGLKKNTPNVERGTSDGQRAFDSDLSASIIVRGIPKAVSRDVLELFFENKARSDAQNVLQKAASTGTLHLPTSKCDVEVNRFEETKHAQYFNEIPHTSLFIKNLPIDSSNETIKSYFEVRCKAKPTDVIRSISRKTALFEFEEAIDIAAMTKTCGHKPLEGNILAILEVDTTRQVKVSGVRAGTSPQVLELYFENHARSKGGEIETVDVVGEEKAFIVTFVHPEDKNIVRFLKHSKYYRERAENCAKDVFGKLLWKNEDGSMSLQISCDVNPTDSDVLRKVNIWEENHTKCFDWISKEIVTIELTDVFEQVDVIVNSSNRKLDMETGVVSKQLLKVAGAELQAECTRKYPKGIHFGKVAKTAAGRMGNCKAIFHGALPRWTTANAQNVLEEFMAECLKSADKKGYTTIAFPALGTGRCEYPSDVVADTLLTSVMEYENDHPDTNIKCVSFVIWSKDVETIKAFTKTKEELTRQRSRKERRRSEPEPRRQTQATVLTVYTNKPRNIKQIESRIKGFKKDEEIFPPASLLEQLTDDRMEVVKKIARENKVKLVKTDKSLKLVGYGKSVERTKKKVESYLDNAEKDLKLTFQTLGTKGVPFPPSWSKTDITDPLKIVQLPPTDPDFVTVSKQFLADTGLPPTNIVKIERIQNPALYGQYFAKKKHMESAGGGPKIERMLWHGTRTPQVANNITSKGFDRNYNHGASHGAGVYFAMNAQMSANGYCAPDAMGQKYIFYANVLTGDFWVGSSGIRVPPPKVPGNTLVTYDSTTDNVAAPNFFVIFHDAQAYPSFMITFK
ncbi:PAR14-like protein [Mya arenaria]|uniref:Poly [ADP-ribose] polymerase n=1 Tax=Mya arenaria TaxID=6604 RepID=A0ABY7FGQ0_MYAAR|nr:PAR14-like protein [Mya arenaria]